MPIPKLLSDDQFNRFDAAKTLYLQQVSLLVTYTKIDLQIIGGYLGIQAFFAASILKAPLRSCAVQWSMTLVDVGCMGIAVYLLFRSKKRRQEVIDTVRRLNEVLGYSVEGVYLESVSINPNHKPKFWFWPYAAFLALSFAGMAVGIWAS